MSQQSGLQRQSAGPGAVSEKCEGQEGRRRQTSGGPREELGRAIQQRRGQRMETREFGGRIKGESDKASAVTGTVCKSCRGERRGEERNKSDKEKAD